MWFSSWLRNRTFSPKRRPASRFRPTFESLVDKCRAGGMAPAAIFDEIVASSQRTDDGVNHECGIDKP